MSFIQKIHPKRITAFLQTQPVERIFLIVAVPALLFFSVAMPALQGWDEAAHFLRAYQVSEGHPTSARLEKNVVGGRLPISVIDMHDAFLTDLILSAQSDLMRGVHTRAYVTYLKKSSTGKARAGKEFVATATYSPVSYAVPAAGIALARNLHLPMISYIYMARLFCLIAYLLLIYYAIKVAPFGKWLIFALAVLPQAITVGVTISPDALVTGVICLLVALFARVYVQKGTITNKQVALATGLVLILALTKQPYALVGAVYLLLPIRKFGSVKHFLLINGIILGVGAIAGLGWLYTIRPYAELGHTIQRPGLNIDTGDQLKTILHNPIRYASIFGNETITNDGNGTITQMTSILTWKGIRLPLWITMLTYLSLFLACVYDLQQRAVRLGSKIRIGSALIALALVGAVYTTLYLGFTVVGSNQIEGINGRYMLAVVPLLILVLENKRKIPTLSFDPKRAPVMLVGLSVFMLFCSALVVIATNYVPNII